jgi:hypothetical protein
VSEADNENRCYGSVNGLAREINAIYGGVNDEAKPITKLYGSVNSYDLLIAYQIFSTTGYPVVLSFNPTTFKTAMLNHHHVLWENSRTKFDRLEVFAPAYPNPLQPKTYSLRLYLYNTSPIELAYGGTTALEAYGITLKSPLPPSTRPTQDYIVLRPSMVAKLIHQAFGHIDYS